jgi:hypothetical protein
MQRKKDKKLNIKHNERDIIFYKEQDDTAVFNPCMLPDGFVGLTAACIMPGCL